MRSNPRSWLGVGFRGRSRNSGLGDVVCSQDLEWGEDPVCQIKVLSRVPCRIRSWDLSINYQIMVVVTCLTKFPNEDNTYFQQLVVLADVNKVELSTKVS
uniref:Uncharacterized protein n=1 Tax=Solanum lycopersicum TaxID=4081 RepID=A0A3Q7GGB0_SOLLC